MARHKAAWRRGQYNHREIHDNRFDVGTDQLREELNWLLNAAALIAAARAGMAELDREAAAS